MVSLKVGRWAAKKVVWKVVWKDWSTVVPMAVVKAAEMGGNKVA